MPARGAVQIAAAVLAAVALGACSSGSSGAVALPSLSESGQAPSAASGSTSSGPSPSGTSDAQVTAEVEAAVRAYFDAANVAIATGEVAGLARHSSRGCNCQELVRSVQQAFASGGSTKGASWTIESLAVVPGSTSIRYVNVGYVASEYVTLDAGGRVLERFEGHRNTAFVQLVRSGESWVVADFDNRKREPL
jgi:hypothetical protein